VARLSASAWSSVALQISAVFRQQWHCPSSSSCSCLLSSTASHFQEYLGLPYGVAISKSGNAVCHATRHSVRQRSGTACSQRVGCETAGCELYCQSSVGICWGLPQQVQLRSWAICFKPREESNASYYHQWRWGKSVREFQHIPRRVTPTHSFLAC
jgi:hypothetical protein